MHRLGFEEADFSELISLLQQNPNIKVVSLFSHFVASDDPQQDAFTLVQDHKFRTWSEFIEKQLGYQVIKHISNTDGILRFERSAYDMVRLGIGLYGIDPSGNFQQHLQNVFALKTVISQIRSVGPGESVGYSRAGISEKSRKIAVIPIGYADGFRRVLGHGNGHVFVDGIKAPVVGNVCMDMCMIDVTHIRCDEGDEVVVFENNIQLGEIASLQNTIPYEVLTSVSQRVRRIYIRE
jgi:alanine racemase